MTTTQNMDTLGQKIDQLKDEHAAETHGQLMKMQDERAMADALFMLGRIRQNENIAQTMSKSLLSQNMRALEYFQENRLYISLGYQTFVEFLDKSEYSPMTKHQYYERAKLLNEHGDEIYDLLTSIGISVRAQKMLGTGELSIKNDTLYVGDREVTNIADTGIIKDVLNELFEEKRRLENETAKLNTKVATQQTQIQKGTDENNELRRNIDAINEGTPFERALMNAVKAMITLTGEVKDLSDEERSERAESDLKTLAAQYFQIRDAYGVAVPLADVTGAQASRLPTGSEADRSSFDAKLEAAIAEPDNLDAEEDLN